MANQKRSLVLPIFLIIGPSLAVVLAIIVYVVVNFLINSSAPVPDTSQGANDSDLFGNSGGSAFSTIGNVVLYLIGAGSILAFVPCLVIGIIMLSKRLAAK